ncbi:hypothetical protein KHC23_15300 [Ancylobacter dichloromethanicus]|uniref:Uncharacterized protein n=1 Tax=Ancylobacter dichloromethanicus TaxID=518825 RepID=A0A9W6MZQ2_9HYPH|nr:hypothetical protein [Ancylobacter dichloromethanicus]MBS7555014.1 hypothetical protein [Ancylobacter dichloromethanicus]GLK72222.1 hypothetical protein GCM10017643_23380 [Ancylobacter dichloromethanicus]
MTTSLSIAGLTYTMQRGSDVERNGMFLELFEGSPNGPCLAEVFYSDQTHTMAFTAFREDLPLEAVEWFIDKPRCACLRWRGGERRLQVEPKACACRRREPGA